MSRLSEGTKLIQGVEGKGEKEKPVDTVGAVLTVYILRGKLLSQ